MANVKELEKRNINIAINYMVIEETLKCLELYNDGKLAEHFEDNYEFLPLIFEHASNGTLYEELEKADCGNSVYEQLEDLTGLDNDILTGKRKINLGIKINEQGIEKYARNKELEKISTIFGWVMREVEKEHEIRGIASKEDIMPEFLERIPLYCDDYLKPDFNNPLKHSKSKERDIVRFLHSKYKNRNLTGNTIDQILKYNSIFKDKNLVEKLQDIINERKEAFGDITGENRTKRDTLRIMKEIIKKSKNSPYLNEVIEFIMYSQDFEFIQKSMKINMQGDITQVIDYVKYNPARVNIHLMFIWLLLNNKLNSELIEKKREDEDKELKKLKQTKKSEETEETEETEGTLFYLDNIFESYFFGTILMEPKEVISPRLYSLDILIYHYLKSSKALSIRYKDNISVAKRHNDLIEVIKEQKSELIYPFVFNENSELKELIDTLSEVAFSIKDSEVQRKLWEQAKKGN